MIQTFILIMWISSSSVTVAPFTFADEAKCRAAGQSFIRQRSSFSASGFACVPGP